MAKAIKPGDCFRGHQIIPTEKLKTLLSRAGFVQRSVRGSHAAFYHPQFPEISPFNLVINTDKRDSQFIAGRAVEKAQDLAARKSAHQARSPEDIWLRTLGRRLDKDGESFEVSGDGVIIRSLEWPAIGVSVPLFAEEAAVSEKIEWFRWALADFSATVERYGQTYGVERSEDADTGTLHLYHAGWRIAHAFDPFNGENGAQNPILRLGQWEAVLRARNAAQQTRDALDAYVQNLAARYPGDAVLRDGDTVIMRDGAAPQIGVLFTPADLETDPQDRWRGMKNAGLNFAARLKKLEDEFDFRIRRGRRTLYLTHAVYEKLEARIPLFSKNADNDLAHAALDSLEAQTLYRDQYLRHPDKELEQTYRLSRFETEPDEDGLVRSKYKMNHIGAAACVVEVCATPNGRMGWADNAQMHEALINLYLGELPRTAALLGYETTRKKGALDFQHSCYRNLTFSIPNYRQMLDDNKVVHFPDRFHRGEAAVTELADYQRSKERSAAGLAVLWQSVERLKHEIDEVMTEYNRVDADIRKQGNYVSGALRKAGTRYEIIYTKRNPAAAGPKECRLPAYHFPSILPAGHYMTSREGLAQLRSLRDGIEHERHEIAALVGGAHHLRAAFTGGALFAAPASKQNVKGAAATLPLPGLGGPKY